MTIGFSLGGCWKIILMDTHPRNRDSYLTWWRVNADYIGTFNAMEIMIPPESEKFFSLSKDNFRWLARDMNHISYHLTQCTDDTIQCLRQFPFIDYIVCHVNQKYMLTDGFIKGYGSKLLFENLEGVTSSFLPSDNICYDDAHANAVGKDYPDRFWKTYHKQIKEIHISQHHPIKKHTPLFEAEYYNPILKIIKNYPVIIESTFENIEDARKELKYLKGRIYDKQKGNSDSRGHGFIR